MTRRSLASIHSLSSPAALGAALTAAPSALAAGDQGGVYLPPSASTGAGEVDYAMNFINVITVVFFVAIIAVMVGCAIKFRRRDPKQRAENQASHNTALELSWSLPPLVIVLYMFWIGFSGYMSLFTVPDDAYTVQVTARKWQWQFTHPNGKTTVDKLHVPAGEPVQLRLASEDVVHSLFIPAFRIKSDAVPGMYNNIWFEATEPTPLADKTLGDNAGEQAVKQLAQKKLANGYQLYCTEYCGTQHSQMRAKVVVHEEGWRPQAGPDLGEGPSVAKGEHLFQIKGCAGCHQLKEDGAKLAGPAFAGGIWGREEQMKGGQTVTVDENYVRESILDPQAKIVAGYPPVMPVVQLSETEVTSLVMFIESIGEQDGD